MSNENPNPFGFNFGNASMKNTFIAVNANIKRGNIDIKSVNAPNGSPQTGPIIENSFIDIGTTKEEGDIKIHDIPLHAKLIEQGQRLPHPPINRRIPLPIAQAPVQPVQTKPEPAPVQQTSENPVSETKPNLAIEPPPQRQGDTTFLVSGTEIRAFKVVLSTKSQIFGAYIKKATPGGQVQLPVFKADVFRAMLDYFDDENSDSVKQFTEQLLEVGEKFAIPDLKTKCERLLMQKIDSDSVAKLLLLAERNKATNLKDNCIFYINECPSIKETDAYQQMIAEQPTLMMDLI